MVRCDRSAHVMLTFIYLYFLFLLCFSMNILRSLIKTEDGFCHLKVQCVSVRRLYSQKMVEMEYNIHSLVCIITK